MLSGKNGQARVLDGRGVGRSGFPVEHRHLPKEIAPVQARLRLIPDHRGLNGDSHPSVLDQIHGVAFISRPGTGSCAHRSRASLADRTARWQFRHPTIQTAAPGGESRWSFR